MNTQPKALRLADDLDKYLPNNQISDEAAVELRRLHEVNQELLESLNKMRNAYIGTCVEVQADAMRTAREAIAKTTKQ